MPRTLLHRAVPDDLQAIYDYLFDRSPDAANRFLDAVPSTLDNLAEFPGLGSPKTFRSTALANIRSWPVPGFPNHLILYRPIDSGIHVLAIVHGARRLSTFLRSRV